MESECPPIMETTSPESAAEKGRVVEFEIELEEHTLLSNQLGSQIYYNSEAEKTGLPRELVTRRETSGKHFLFHVRCQRPKFGTYDGQPACLIVFDHAFRTSLTKSRFKHARIEILFEDAAMTSLDPDDDADTDAFMEAMKYQPRILDFEPHLFHGKPDSKDGSRGFQAGISFTNPGFPVTPSANYSSQTPTIKEGMANIHGLLEDNSCARASWAVDENDLRKSGIFSNFSTPVIVSYTKGRKFAASVEVSVKIEWRPMRFLAGKGDDPLYFDPEKFSTTTPIPDLKSIPLRSLCRLDLYEGTFGPSN